MTHSCLQLLYNLSPDVIVSRATTTMITTNSDRSFEIDDSLSFQKVLERSLCDMLFRKSVFEKLIIQIYILQEQRAISSRQGLVEEQTRLWENTLQLLRTKMRARIEPTVREGRMHITQHSQMLTLTQTVYIWYLIYIFNNFSQK